METRKYCLICERTADDECIAIGHTLSLDSTIIESGDSFKLEDIFRRNKDLTKFLRDNAPRPDMPEKVIECLLAIVPIGEDSVVLNGIRYPKAELEKMIRELSTMRNTLALYAEVAEYNDETPFKWWGRGAWETQKEKAGEELVDTLHFLMIAFEDLGYTADDIHKMYCKKNRANWERFKTKLGWKKPQR